MARVAVVIPAFRAETHVGDAVRSVFSQTLQDWEAVVVDDGSPDATAEAAEGAAAGDSRVRVVRAARSGLPAVARNLGIELTSASLVAFLDADDVWYPEKLARQVAVFAARPDVGVVHCLAQRHDDEKPLATSEDDADPDLPFVRRLVRENAIVTSSVVVRRSLLDEHGGFDADPNLRGTEDLELWLRLARHAQFEFVGEPLLAYRAHNAQLSADRPWMNGAAIAALDKAKPLFPEFRGDFARSIGIRRCMERPGGGRRELLEALRHDPRDGLAWSWLLRSVVGRETVSRAGRALRRAQSRASALS
jgi:GT2 family glycosyltransferase